MEKCVSGFKGNGAIYNKNKLLRKMETKELRGAQGHELICRTSALTFRELLSDD